MQFSRRKLTKTLIASSAALLLSGCFNYGTVVSISGTPELVQAADAALQNLTNNCAGPEVRRDSHAIVNQFSQTGPNLAPLRKMTTERSTHCQYNPVFTRPGLSQ